MAAMRLPAVILCFLLAGSFELAAQKRPVFSVDADFIRVPVTVFDKSGGLISNLTRYDFILRDEGELSPIANFVLDKAPVNVVLLLDVSGSLQEEIKEIRVAAFRFAQAFGREDRIAIIAFDDKVELLQPWTNKPGKIKKSLKKLKPGYRTALYDALLETTRNTLEKTAGRKVIILLTDGLDNESYSNYGDVVDGLIRSGVSLYIVSRTRLVLPQVQKSGRVEFLNRVMKSVLNEEDTDFVDIYFQKKESAMTHLAESTGGRVLFPEKLEELRRSYRQVARELKNQYVLTFQPPSVSQKQFRSIDLQCRGEVGRMFHRKQYSWTKPGSRTKR